MKSWNEIGKNAAAFSKRWKAAHDENRWRSSDFNFCMANVSKSNIRSMQTNAGITANGKELSKADLISIPSDGYVFSNAELDALSSGEQLLVVEARQRNNLVVSVELDGAELYS